MPGLCCSLASLFAAAALLAACSKAPAEPDAPASASPGSAVAPLVWEAPGTWARLDVPRSGAEKAAYRIEGAAPAEVHVFFLGTGSKGDPAQAFKEWFAQFDGDVGAQATREELEAHGLKIETVEVHGTYKVPLTPTPRGRKVAPVQSVKKDYRLYGAVIETPDRGNWFFRLHGPDEAVQAARSAFRGMLESAR
jgi:hypothetical protein